MKEPGREGRFKMPEFTFLEASFWLLLKVFILLGIALYFVFAVVVIKQVNLMTETVEMPVDPTLRTLAWAHFIFALAVFLIALFTL